MGVHHHRHSNWHPLTWLSHLLDVRLSGWMPGSTISSVAAPPAGRRAALPPSRG
jgi:hypothetical protein